MISVLQLGTIDYATGLHLQERLIALRKDGRIADVLLLLEHTPVITLGRNAKCANVLASPELLVQRGVEVFECDRGGDVTFHGPGQLVGYPLFDLRGIPSENASRKTLGAVEYVRRLEEVLIHTCTEFGIPAKRISGLTGVWTGEDARPSKTQSVATDIAASSVEPSSTSGSGNTSVVSNARVGTGALARPAESKTQQSNANEGKIAALGVHISRGVTSHGLALNVNTDLSFFNLIVPCGITSKPVTSMQTELKRAIPMQDVAHALSRNFGTVFHSQMLWLDNLDALLGNNLGLPMRPPENLRTLHGEDDSALA
ncbi:MAG: Octanoyltransferase [Acidobacteriaceae bacterium]|nr:Octanoyltransferase [Acidobacteriaceae bacterium]